MTREPKSGRRRRRLWVEALEDRTAPAGLVTAQLLLDGTLQITGDGLRNNITVQTIGDDLLVTGFQTAVNGVAQKKFEAAEVARIAMNLGAGNDTASLANLAILGGITVVDDLGNDNYTATALNMPTSALNISTGVGEDNVVVGTSTLGGLIVNTGDDFDEVILNANNSPGINFATILTGRAMDEVQIENSRFNVLQADTGGGDDEFVLEDVFAGTLQANTGAGNDFMNLDGVNTNNLIASTGAGEDFINLEGVTSTGLLIVDAGAGGDFVLATDVVAMGVGLVDGGTGDDVLEQNGVNFFVALNFEGFI